jgi:hypothetical protein
MEKPENFYELLGLPKSATEMDIAQVYRTLVQKLQDEKSPDQADRAARRMRQLDTAYQALLDPERRRKHDEKIAWFAARQKLAAEKTIQLEWQLKEQQQAADATAKRAALAAAQWANEEARQAADDAKRTQELARVQAEADERFSRLRAQRSHVWGGGAWKQAEFADTVANAGSAPTDHPSASHHPMLSRVAQWTILASVLAVALVFVAVLRWQSVPSKARALAAADPAAALSSAATQPNGAAAPEKMAGAGIPPAQPEAKALASANAAPKPAAKLKAGLDDSAKAAEAVLYQKTLKRVEAEHPELNPVRPEYRLDAITYVAARLQVHLQAGHAKARALEIAVRDLEAREQTRIAIDKPKNPKVERDAPAALDKGGHVGFDPKCRWVTPEQWSCK